MLSGKVAMVTGGSRGIGRAISTALAEAGADVAVIYAGNRDAAEETADRIREAGRQAAVIQADVSDAGQVDSAVKEVLKTFGRIDILVNNAGITRDNLMLRMKEEDWDRVVDTNLKGVFLCIKAVTRPMLKQRAGRIINISSVVGISGNPGQANYVAAKAGVIGLTKSAAKELASRGITVNAVAPGFIETDMTAQLGEEVRGELMSQIPLSRLGKPEDVAGAVRFLASDAAGYITGQTLHVDGGMVTS
ncbi:3-oxoacyl-[acyl-carrier-protein] reductase [Kroppenstedtia eburnea]|uniref:3-oxoacyl-[acyl-carrier-protein] reductase n=1 Tax=Kroppenstedtia eburnea TaxID=714067 RepID=A0A1N7J0X9_9BACL|nr:3-oxoacyl-[acyl-carrier-protein] reductase [Kroppenstedtia eburnea]EGK13474.1 3-oxoacyl-[acyl-carrier-protein] reductase [Desmospora sp. 8437]QKI82409.1 3-oxoacyl-[acyl-carrier-protein] reductase [Kroppenstedtia eburnea]SIS43042.1 3-oxoacyl-[acyl-carrier-protein] reductase [Kroppenstedtia eburnea]